MTLSAIVYSINLRYFHFINEKCFIQTEFSGHFGTRFETASSNSTGSHILNYIEIFDQLWFFYVGIT